jgi:MSHA biogenesis protein MshJ
VKETLKRYAERIDAASLRERVMIFLAATLVLAFLVNVALLEPLRAAQKRNLAESAQLREEMKPVQGQIATMAQSAARDLNAPNRAKLAELREQLAQLGTRVAQEQRRFTPPERMRGVLEEMLRRNRGLALLDLKTLPVMPVAVGGSAVPGAPKPAAGPPSGIYRHGIEFTVSGSYSQVYDYLRALENLPTQLYWARAELVVTEHPVLTLKLTAFTVSFDPAWLIV